MLSVYQGQAKLEIARKSGELGMSGDLKVGEREKVVPLSSMLFPCFHPSMGFCDLDEFLGTVKSKLARQTVQFVPGFQKCARDGWIRRLQQCSYNMQLQCTADLAQDHVGFSRRGIKSACLYSNHRRITSPGSSCARSVRISFRLMVYCFSLIVCTGQRFDPRKFNANDSLSSILQLD